MRARDLPLELPGVPGQLNAITDVPGFLVGMTTVISDEVDGALRTGVTALLPVGRERVGDALVAGVCALNGNGELTGSHWITESGSLSGPIMITNTHAVGTVHRGVIDWIAQHHSELASQWLLPVVAETWDGYLNSINRQGVTAEDVTRAIDGATCGPVLEGSHGGGTGMACYGFKGGNGTASRIVPFAGNEYTVGVFVQANFGDRTELVIGGVLMGDLEVPNPLGDLEWWQHENAVPPGAGSVIVVIATDAPLLPHQCTALARRASLGIARTGTSGSHFSGDLFLACSTAHAGALTSGFPVGPQELRTLSFVPWNRMDAFYSAVVQAVEESVLNALVNNTSLTGRDGHWLPALPTDQVSDRLLASHR